MWSILSSITKTLIGPNTSIYEKSFDSYLNHPRDSLGSFDRMILSQSFDFPESAGFSVPTKWKKLFFRELKKQSSIIPHVTLSYSEQDRYPISSDVAIRYPGESVLISSKRPEYDESIEVVDMHVILMSLTNRSQYLLGREFTDHNNVDMGVIHKLAEYASNEIDYLSIFADGSGKGIGIQHALSETEFDCRMDNIENIREHLLNMIGSLAPIDRKKAKWMMNMITFEKLKRILPDGFSENEQELMGLSIIKNEFMSTINSGDPFLILGNFNEYHVGLKESLSLRRFDDSQYREMNQFLLLGRIRLGNNLKNKKAFRMLR